MTAQRLHVTTNWSWDVQRELFMNLVPYCSRHVTKEHFTPRRSLLAHPASTSKLKSSALNAMIGTGRPYISSATIEAERQERVLSRR